MDFTHEELKILQEAIDHYGEESQLDMAIEEMSELTKATAKKEVKKTDITFDLVMSEEAKEVLNEIKATLQEINNITLSTKPTRLQVRKKTTGEVFTFVQYADDGKVLVYDKDGAFLLLYFYEVTVIT